MSNIFSTLMIIVVTTTTMVEEMIGTMIRQNTCHSVQPSIRPESMRFWSTPFSEAERMTMQKPVQIHTATAMSASVLNGGRLKCQADGSKFGTMLVSSAFSVPVCTSPAG